MEARRDAFGVEPICRAVGVPVSTYYARRSRKPSRRTLEERTLVARDLLQRDFRATRPNEKWVADITYLRTWNGFLYLAFILDCYSRMIVGWQLATHLRTDLVMDALELPTACASRARTPNTRRSTGSASTTPSGCTKNSMTCRPPSTRS